MTATKPPGLEEIGARLAQREKELGRRLGHVVRDRRRERGALDPDFGEQAVERQNDEVLDGLDQVERAEFEATRAALRRIETGTFGTCPDCEEPIPAARLEADPTAERCVACAEARERAG